MLVAALILFVVGALGGLVMARQIFAGQEPAKAIAIAHGLANGTALVLLLVAFFSEELADTAQTALVLFVFAAVGGLYLVSHHLRHKPHPRGIVVVHGLIAASGVVALALAVF